MISLEQIQVASPCHADWDGMTGTEQVRFCQGCRKNVYNLSAMTHDEAQALVEEKEGRLCVRFYRRADGTMLTQDCPVGLRAVRVKLAKKWSYAAALLLSCGTGLLRWSGSAQAVTTVKPAASAAKPPSTPSAAPPTSKSILEQVEGWFASCHAPRPVMGAPMAVLSQPRMGQLAAPPPPPRVTHKKVHGDSSGIRRLRTGGGGANSGSKSATRVGRGAGGS